MHVLCIVIIALRVAGNAGKRDGSDRMDVQSVPGQTNILLRILATLHRLEQAKNTPVIRPTRLWNRMLPRWGMFARTLYYIKVSMHISWTVHYINEHCVILKCESICMIFIKVAVYVESLCWLSTVEQPGSSFCGTYASLYILFPVTSRH